jgi:hypothetical protein
MARSAIAIFSPCAMLPARYLIQNANILPYFLLKI